MEFRRLALYSKNISSDFSKIKLDDYKPPLKLSQCDFVGLKWFKTLFANKTQVAQMVQVMKNTFAIAESRVMLSPA